MQMPSLAQEVPKPGFPEAGGAPVGRSTLHLTQLHADARSWSTAHGEMSLVSQGAALPAAIARHCWGLRRRRRVVLELMPLP